MIITDDPKKFILENMGESRNTTSRTFESYFEKDFGLFKLFGTKSLSKDGASHFELRPYMEYLGTTGDVQKYYVFAVKYDWMIGDSTQEDFEHSLDMFSKAFISDIFEAAEIGIDSDRFNGPNWKEPKKVLYSE